MKHLKVKIVFGMYNAIWENELFPISIPNVLHKWAELCDVRFVLDTVGPAGTQSKLSGCTSPPPRLYFQSMRRETKPRKRNPHTFWYTIL